MLINLGLLLSTAPVLLASVHKSRFSHHKRDVESVPVLTGKDDFAFLQRVVDYEIWFNNLDARMLTHVVGATCNCPTSAGPFAPIDPAAAATPGMDNPPQATPQAASSPPAPAAPLDPSPTQIGIDNSALGQQLITATPQAAIAPQASTVTTSYPVTYTLTGEPMTVTENGSTVTQAGAPQTFTSIVTVTATQPITTAQGRSIDPASMSAGSVVTTTFPVTLTVTGQPMTLVQSGSTVTVSGATQTSTNTVTSTITQVSTAVSTQTSISTTTRTSTTVSISNLISVSATTTTTTATTATSTTQANFVPGFIKVTVDQGSTPASQNGAVYWVGQRAAGQPMPATAQDQVDPGAINLVPNFVDALPVYLPSYNNTCASLAGPYFNIQATLAQNAGTKFNYIAFGANSQFPDNSGTASTAVLGAVAQTPFEQQMQNSFSGDPTYWTQSQIWTLDCVSKMLVPNWYYVNQATGATKLVPLPMQIYIAGSVNTGDGVSYIELFSHFLVEGPLRVTAQFIPAAGATFY